MNHAAGNASHWNVYWAKLKNWYYIIFFNWHLIISLFIYLFYIHIAIKYIFTRYKLYKVEIRTVAFFSSSIFRNKQPFLKALIFFYVDVLGKVLKIHIETLIKNTIIFYEVILLFSHTIERIVGEIRKFS